MSRSRAETPVTRIAVIGAGTAVGALVRAALAKEGVEGARVDLFGDPTGDAVLSDYAGEARLIQPPDAREVLAHDVIFLCEAGAAASFAIAAAGSERIVLDLVAAAGREADAPVVHPDINPEAAKAHRGILRVPHAISCILAEVLAPIERVFGVRSATAFVLRPASDFGEPGVEELRDQTLSLLRFAEPPRDVFGGRQLAFSVIPQWELDPAAATALEQRIAQEVESILGWTEARLALELAIVPVFHGHTLSMRLEPARAAGEDEVRAASEGTTVVSVAPDGLGGFWLRALADQASESFAARAVRVARAAGNL